MRMTLFQQRPTQILVLSRMLTFRCLIIVLRHSLTKSRSRTWVLIFFFLPLVCGIIGANLSFGVILLNCQTLRWHLSRKPWVKPVIHHHDELFHVEHQDVLTPLPCYVDTGHHTNTHPAYTHLKWEWVGKKDVCVIRSASLICDVWWTS